MTKFISLGETTGADQGMADFLTAYGFEEVKKPEDADIIVFNGGADVGTQIYGEPHYRTGEIVKASQRDLAELQIFKKFNRMGPFSEHPRLLLGICRGAQFLNVLSGGNMWQDVNNHGSDHLIQFSLGTEWRDEKPVKATSTHHQMMYVGKQGELIAYATESTKRISTSFYPKTTDVDPEIVWYPNRGALCIQGHPEYVPDSEFSRLCIRLIEHYMKEVSLSVA